MTDQRWRGDGFWDVCKTFEQIMSGGKLHQYLRILVKADILNIEYEDENDLMNKFLSNPDLHKIAHDAWENQQVLVSVRSGVNVHNLANHVHEVIKNHLADQEAEKKAIEHFAIADPSSERAKAIIAKAKMPIYSLNLRSPYTIEQRGFARAGQLLGLSKKDLVAIDGVGEKTAQAILDGLRQLFTENSRAVALVKRRR